MPKTLDEMIDRLPPARREVVDNRAADLIEEEMTLRALRKASALTQERMAEMLHIGQDSVSRIEQRSDLLISTLRSYVAAMGGELELIARFPDRKPVVLSGLADISGGGRKKGGQGRLPSP